MPKRQRPDDPRVKICVTCKGEREVKVYEGRKFIGMKPCPACNSKGGKHLGTI